MFAALAGTSIVGFDPYSRDWLSAGATQSRPFERVPHLDGQLLLGLEERSAVALDGGNLVHRIPAAVLRPRSARDIARMVEFANRQKLKARMRGQAHSKYGQTQVEGGIVIDSSSMITIGTPSANGVDVEPGVTIGDLLRRTLAVSLMPPVAPNCMQLTVGGFLSAGGMGDTGHRHGAFVDNVLALDVVTGDGRQRHCSERRDRDLFEMVLGGMGQCGIVTRARLRLRRAPTNVMLQRLTYRDLEAYLADQTRLATDGPFDDLGSVVTRGADDTWRYVLRVGAFCEPSDAPAFASFTRSLSCDEAEPPTRVTMQEYHYRDVARDVAALAGGRALQPSPGLALWVPASLASEFVKTVFGSPRHVEGLTRISFTAMNERLHETAVPRPAIRARVQDLAVQERRAWRRLRSCPQAHEQP